MRKKIFLGLILLVIILIIFSLVRQISVALTAGNRLDQAANELTALQQQNQRLQNRLANVQQYDFIEQTARNKLDMSKPGETMVIIPQKDMETVLGAEKKPTEVKLPNWQVWLNLIFH